MSEASFMLSEMKAGGSGMAGWQDISTGWIERDPFAVGGNGTTVETEAIS